MSTNSHARRGALMNIPLRNLRLDPENPRIPEADRGKPTNELAPLIELGYEAFPVAQSIAELGFFNAEPLIVVPSHDQENTWIVVEGNRRLTALLGLADPEIRSSFPSPGRWDELAEKRSISLDQEIPAVAHESRQSTHAEVARQHVVGKLPWRPYMQAKWIAARVAEGKSIQEVADLIGITKSKAADLYRDQAVLSQAQSMGLDTSQAEEAFSLLTVALSTTKIRNHIGAPLGSQLKFDQPPIPVDKKSELGEVIQWIFGDEDNEPKITDSRKIPMLGNVISNEVGLEALRSGKTLEEAKQKVSDSGLDAFTSLKNRLNTALNALTSASNDVAEFASNPDIQQLVDDIASVLESIRSIQFDSTSTEM